MFDTVERMRVAAGGFDWAGVEEGADDYAAGLRAGAAPADRGEYAPVLSLLRQHRRYAALLRVIDELLAQRVADTGVTRLLGQAQVEQGFPAAALATLVGVDTDPSTSEGERVEVRGSMGRCHKELYLRTTDRPRREWHLRQAVTLYWDAYQQEPAERHWSGINVVALLARAAAEGIALPEHRDPGQDGRRLAATVLDTVRSRPADDMWAQATAVEAMVALRDHAGAARQLEDFIIGASPDAFALNSLLRQFTQVWKLNTDSPPGSTLIPQLRSQLLERIGGVVSLAPWEVRAERVKQLSRSEGFEKVLGTDRYLTFKWYLNGLTRCRAVARIETENDDGVGTGFLVSGQDLHPGLPKLLLMTNAHVVPEAISVEDAVIAFHASRGADGQPLRFRPVRQWWSASSQAPGLDTTLLELDGYPEEVVPVPVSERIPNLAGATTPRAYVIGHPRGLEQPQFSLQDNHLLAVNETRLHYRSPTEPGSSGSPVFDRQWNLIGLHHAGSLQMLKLDGSGVYPANEGILLSAIKRRLREVPPS
jgi:V8-like Glu-specific endopeptidase